MEKLPYILVIGVLFLIIICSALSIPYIIDGLGYKVGRSQAGIFIHMAKLNLADGQLFVAGRNISAALNVIVDSEVRWNKAQPHVEQFETLSRQGRLPEALIACRTAIAILGQYDPFDGFRSECRTLIRTLER